MVVYIFLGRRIDGLHFNGIRNIPLMKLEAFISAARLVSGVDAAPKRGRATK